MQLDVSPLAGWTYRDLEANSSADTSLFEADFLGASFALAPLFRGCCWNALTGCLLVCDPVECCVRILRVTRPSVENAAGGASLLRFAVNADMARIGGKGTGSGKFMLPVAVDVNARGEIAVADAKLSRVQVFMGSGTLQYYFGRPGGSRGEFRNISDLKFTHLGHLAVVDTGNHRIQIMTQTGGLVAIIGKFGWRLGEFSSPCAIDISRSGDLFVCDQGNKRIQRLTAKGKLIAVWGSTRQQRNRRFEQGAGVVLSTPLMTTSTESAPALENDDVDEFGAALSPLLQSVFDTPSDVAISANGEVIVCDSGASGRILCFSDTGTCHHVLTSPVQWQPIAICFCGDILVTISRSPLPGSDNHNAMPEPEQTIGAGDEGSIDPSSSSCSIARAYEFSLASYPAPQRVSIGKLSSWPVRCVLQTLRFLTYADAIEVRCVSHFLHRLCRSLRNEWQLSPLLPGSATVRKYNKVVTRATGLVAVAEAFDAWGLRVYKPSQHIRRHVMDFESGFCSAISSLYGAMFRFQHEDILRALFQFHARNISSNTSSRGDEVDRAAFVEIVTLVEEVRAGFLRWEQCPAFRGVRAEDIPTVRTAKTLSLTASAAPEDSEVASRPSVPAALYVVECAQQQQLNKLVGRLMNL